jgi:hypothetical protein
MNNLLTSALFCRWNGPQSLQKNFFRAKDKATRRPILRGATLEQEGAFVSHQRATVLRNG